MDFMVDLFVTSRQRTPIQMNLYNISDRYWQLQDKCMRSFKSSFSI